jgi:DNA repair protein RecN (Recombination protein N)
MLSTLSIRNFAIIDQLQIEFNHGLNVLTGETGAGKSIIMGALNAILGGRTGSEVVRGGATRASIDGVFDIGGAPHVRSLLNEMGYDAEDDQLLVSREVAASGKSSARIGGRPATVAQLKELGDWLVDLHGQHEHQSLLATARHIDLLDEWAGRELLSLRAQAADAFRSVRQLEQEIAAIERDARERERMLDLYRYQTGEIFGAELQSGEEEALLADSRRLGNAQRLAELTGAAAASLGGDDTAELTDTLASALRNIETAAALDESLQPLADRVTAATYELQEAARDLSRYRDEIEYNPERLEAIEERLETIRGLKRKYGDSIDEILEYGRKTADQLQALELGEERGQHLRSELEEARACLSNLCGELSRMRRERADVFQSAVLAELVDLNMEKTRFEVQIDPIEPTAKGADRVEFVIAPNPGEPMRPLAKIASGGEISRVMLSIKSAMARQEPLPTMVFDEIDVGVGGRTASVIAGKLSALGSHAQIICITHLAQIASRATKHLYIEKQVQDERTRVSVVALSERQRIDEVARMIGGTEITETVRRHAEEMLQVG